MRTLAKRERDEPTGDTAPTSHDTGDAVKRDSSHAVENRRNSQPTNSSYFFSRREMPRAACAINVVRDGTGWKHREGL